MTTDTMLPNMWTLSLTEDERARLVNLLEVVLRDKAVEAHRTDNPDYRQFIEQEQAALQSVFDKLRRR